jgi:hypothetical protein
MVTKTVAKSLDVQKLVTSTTKLEVKLLSAGVDTMQVWANQVSRLSGVVGGALQNIQNDISSVSDIVSRLTNFGRQNAQAFGQLSERLNILYYDVIDRFANKALSTSKIVRNIQTAPIAKFLPTSSRPVKKVAQINKTKISSTRKSLVR